MSVRSPLVTEEYLQELAERGEALYNTLKATLEPEFNGQHIAIHVETEDYAIAKFSTIAARELSQRHPIDGRIYSRQIGPDPDTDFVARHAALDILAGPPQMILGHVRDYMPRVSLMLPGVNGPLSVEFILDTGFDGELSLPPSLLPQLEMSFFRECRLQGADGRVIVRVAYMIDLEWNEAQRSVEVMVLENVPLLGAILLDESHIDLDMRSGGEVMIEPD